MFASRFHLHRISRELRRVSRLFSASNVLPTTTTSTHKSPLATTLINPYLQSLRNYATNPENTSSVLDTSTFENICEETLDGLTEYFEELVELDPTIVNADISYSSGVLTVTLGTGCTYVINKQTPNKQIWLSSPTSGPKRFDFDVQKQCWVYKHTGENLHQLLQQEMPKIFKVKEIDFFRCCYSSKGSK